VRTHACIHASTGKDVYLKLLGLVILLTSYGGCNSRLRRGKSKQSQ